MGSTPICSTQHTMIKQSELTEEKRKEILDFIQRETQAASIVLLLADTVTVGMAHGTTREQLHESLDEIIGDEEAHHEH